MASRMSAASSLPVLSTFVVFFDETLSIDEISSLGKETSFTSALENSATSSGSTLPEPFTTAPLEPSSSLSLFGLRFCFFFFPALLASFATTGSSKSMECNSSSLVNSAWYSEHLSSSQRYNKDAKTLETRRSPFCPSQSTFVTPTFGSGTDISVPGILSSQFLRRFGILNTSLVAFSSYCFMVNKKIHSNTSCCDLPISEQVSTGVIILLSESLSK
mmetsp:Transcript_18592/g.40251  ORF Transcript_18592/g.40251 Transcript_18592/m.40251 type:complete len:217 (+) Transcript_18592:928-1578(+)